ncbi:MAG: hypothetical protein JW714_02015 [Candidatus Omnitrophica bacterium]|nr:hypothetical protein [Candidatus Omnitrophota bacterium]
MSLELLTRHSERRHLEFGEKKLSLEQLRRQRMLSSELLGYLAPKHYPRFFLDERLKSRFR